MLRLLPTVLILAVWIYAFIDCLNTPDREVRKLPKGAWVLIVLFFGMVLLGSVAWFVVGRPRRNTPYGATRPAERRWVAPDDNPEFLRSITERNRRPEPESEKRPEPGPETGDKKPRRDRERDGELGRKRDARHDAGRDKEHNNNTENGGGADEAPPAAS
ncbi:hypothetical protein CUT44_22650 [Streptomyces carminius]|uniref:Cardiolipin synthase N-terminal domain-containing protein n=1 Tax=Streptomyces carminius TaxID=2665496 RepID=A0A2M8LUG6_9ACTN|nr:PLD nuclease N-terminal domain-containing protein [Streptomyces carminius]PJE95569.1 hypothetical protein CUT44_22650 [Streptomyces carminius]